MQSAHSAPPTVILTRPTGRNDRLAERLIAAGVPTLKLPALNIEPLPVASGACDPEPAEYDLVIFVSALAARFYFDHLNQRSSGAPWPSQTRVATVGEASAQILPELGVSPHAEMIYPKLPTGQDSEGLWEHLRPRIGRDVHRVLIVCGEGGRMWLSDRLQEAGAAVYRLPLYRRVPACWQGEDARALCQAMAGDGGVIMLVTSVESWQAIRSNLHRLDLLTPRRQSRFVAIHDRIAARLRDDFLASGKVEGPVIKLCAPSDESIFQAIWGMLSQGRNRGLQSRHDKENPRH